MEKHEERTEVAARFGEIIEKDPPLPGEFRPASELPASPEEVAAGIQTLALTSRLSSVETPDSMSVDNAAVVCLQCLAHYHEDIDKRVYSREAMFLRSMSTEDVAEMTPEVIDEVQDRMKAVDLELADMLKARTEQLAASYIRDLETLLDAVSESGAAPSGEPRTTGGGCLVVLALLARGAVQLLG